MENSVFKMLPVHLSARAGSGCPDDFNHFWQFLGRNPEIMSDDFSFFPLSRVGCSSFIFLFFLLLIAANGLCCRSRGA